MTLSTLLTAAVPAVFTVMVLFWWASVRLSDTSIVDIAWGLLFIGIAWLGLLFGAGWLPRTAVVAGLVTLWGLRLSVYIGFRNLGKGEDRRYAAWRKEYGARWPLRSLFTVFFLQATVAIVVALPIAVVATSPTPTRLTLWDTFGVIAWILGFGLESVADRQLRRFKAEGISGRVLDRGVWRYSRHPNYFGEALLWWGIGLIACSTPRGWVYLISPLMITLLLRFVSGVPLAEEAMKGRPGWDRYKAQTSAFIPMPRRKA